MTTTTNSNVVSTFPDKNKTPELPGTSLWERSRRASFNGDANIVNEFTLWINDNLGLVRGAVYGTGALGVFLVFRSIRFATKFTQPHKIPRSFIRRGIKLRGTVHEITTDGTLHVNHLPLFRMPWHRIRDGNQLPVRLAAVQPTIPGIYWMKLRIEKTPIWFQCLAKDRETAHCVVYTTRTGSLSKSVNMELIQDGRATLASPSALNTLKSFRTEGNMAAKLVSHIEKGQKYAKSHRAGLWYYETNWDRFVMRLKGLVRKLLRRE